MKFNQIKYYLLFTAIGFVGGLCIYDRCFNEGAEVIEVRYDSTIYRFDTIEVPQPYKVTEYVHTTQTDTLILTDTIYLYDTIRIVQDFKFKRFYSDTIRDDQLVAYLSEQVQFNRITERDFSYKILRPTNIVANKPNSIGIGLIYYTKPVPNIFYQYDKWRFSAGYNQELYFGIQYNLISF